MNQAIQLFFSTSLLIGMVEGSGSAGFSLPFTHIAIETQGNVIVKAHVDPESGYVLTRLDVKLEGERIEVPSRLVTDIDEVDLSSIAISHSLLIDAESEEEAIKYTEVQFGLFEYDGEASSSEKRFTLTYVFDESGFAYRLIMCTCSGRQVIIAKES